MAAAAKRTEKGINTAFKPARICSLKGQYPFVDSLRIVPESRRDIQFIEHLCQAVGLFVFGRRITCHPRLFEEGMEEAHNGQRFDVRHI